MTVYFAPRSNYTGFLNDLGRGAAGIVTNLIGQQVAGMFDRANKAREVEAARAVMGALGNTASMNEEQMLGSLLSNPQWGKLSADNQKQLMYLAGLRGKNYGGDMYRRGVIGQGGTNAQADTVIGAQLLGLGDGNVGKTIDWTHPKFETQLIDQGDQYTLGQINPYRPGGIVSSSIQTFDKAVSPDAQLTADVTREGYRNALDVARLKNAGLVTAARAKAGRGGGGAPDLPTLKEIDEGLTALDEKLGMLPDNETSKQTRDYYLSQVASLNAMKDEWIRYYGSLFGWQSPEETLAALGATPEQIREAQRQGLGK